MNQGLRLLAIHAHPDDESSKGAATMARYVSEGKRVMVVTCTGGERGDILNPALLAEDTTADDIAAIRRTEMAQAAAILGVEHMWLGYEDSGLPSGDPLPSLPEGCFALQDNDEVVRRLVGVLRTFRPHVIITYDENGGYPHPDHLKVHEVSMLAWDACADPEYAPELGGAWAPLKMYYTHGFIRQRLELFDAESERLGQPRPYQEILGRWKSLRGDIMSRVTTQVDVANFFEQRDDALRAHATQIDPAGMFFATPLDVQRRLWPTEEFELARTRIDVPGFEGVTRLPGAGMETDLFAGIEDES
ncbi:mycothiol conjugate amidase Mca [Corynebacterium argentoratense]|uniref:mycothiol conjugate amidase Mca n=1 Tax=Corynebacterium argentoratense TaxID=42817 RepID=UPI001F3AFD74|nr:mycothiol conjugate amidase Mca [Corynebacterium argentoratense]MCF1711833.1 mycothiol conjugate amidase Mca [Corynebacterium argentoratense]